MEKNSLECIPGWRYALRWGSLLWEVRYSITMLYNLQTPESVCEFKMKEILETNVFSSF